jgi:beta-lactamase class A
MLANLQKLTIGDALKPASRELLVNWRKANKTGNERMRAKLPDGWRSETRQVLASAAR